MKVAESKARREKWLESSKRFSGWDTSKQRDVQQEEANLTAKWLLALKLPQYDILEIGCGNGFFGKILIEKLLAAGAPFTYHFTDFLPECLDKAKDTTRALGVSEKLSFSVLDVYEIDSITPPSSQQIIVSTGFASPATYAQAVPKVARVLKKDGILICDFVNHFSPLVFLSRPFYSIKKLAHSIYVLLTGGSAEERYHFGIFGVRSFFKTHGLTLKSAAAIRFRRNPIICMFWKR